jgi:formate hydrogenlyase transcriptional activator
MPDQPGAQDKPDALLHRYQTLLEVSDVIHACRDLEELFRKVGESLHRVVAFDAIAIGLLEEDKQSLRLSFLESWFANPVDAGLTVPLSGVPGGWVVEHQRALRVRSHEYHPQYQHHHNERMKGAGLAVSFHLPLTTSLTRLGELVFSFRDERELPDSEIEFMQRAADQVAVAIENARNFDEVRRAHLQLEERNKQRELLLELTNSIVSDLDLTRVLQEVARGVRRVVPSSVAVVVLPDESPGHLRIEALDFPEGKGLLQQGLVVPIDGTMAGKAFKDGAPVVANQIDPRNYSPDVYRRLMGEGLQSQCMVPFVSHGRALGVLGLGRREEKGFNDDDVEFLGHVAGQVAIAVENAMAYREITELKDRLTQEKLYLEDEIRSEIAFEEIVGESSVLKNALRKVETVAASDATVLILGETGTGKELIARAIHESSKRKGRTFVKLNCAAIPSGLLESELFGHEKGAFTGAIAQKIGRMELANGGTLFLDEVGDIPLELQPKLLRALQEREFERLGSVRTQKADVRFLAATNRDLAKMVNDKEFRSDLFYRLNVFPIRIPPLRERLDDIPRLVRYFVSKYAKKMDKRIGTISAAAMEKLQSWHWPGNVRELENFIERSVILTEGNDLHVSLGDLEGSTVSSPQEAPSATLRETEREQILKILRETKWMLSGPSGAAARLGVKRTTLQYRMKKLGIERDSE